MDTVNIPAVQKFTYSLSCLQGSAQAAIAGMAITSANYEGAIEILKRRSGDKKLIKSALYQRLNDIRCAGPKLSDLRTTVEMIDKVCNQLSAYGEDVNHPGIVVQLEKKLPPGIRLKLEEAKLVFPDWNVNIMREKLHELIKLRERVYEDNEYKSSKGNGFVRETRQRPTIQSIKSSFNKSTELKNEKRKFPCAFCRRDHYHDECTKYKTIGNRKERISELKLCPRCLRSKHFVAPCNYNRPCFYCNENHHRALCESKFNTTRREVGNNEREVIVVQQINVEELSSLPSPESNQNDMQVASLRSCNETVKEITERVVFLTVKAIVENQSSKYKTSAHIFFDSGSQLTFISERLRQKLNLAPLTEEILTLHTFVAKKPLKKLTQLVEFYLLLKNDERKLIQAYVMGKVSEELQRINERRKAKQSYQIHSSDPITIGI